MIRLEEASVVLNDKTILRSVSVHWKPGEGIALLGANGAGKSTLLKVVATLLKPSTGKLFLPKGMDMRAWRQAIGSVLSQPFVYESLSAKENLQFYAGLYNITDRIRIDELLQQVGLFHVHNEPVRVFSKGMKQRLSIARALLHRPKYLLLDEPFDGLDSDAEDHIKRLLLQLKLEGTGWLLVSHDVKQAWDMCDRSIHLHQGRIIAERICEPQSLSGFMKDLRVMGKESPYAIL